LVDDGSKKVILDGSEGREFHVWVPIGISSERRLFVRHNDMLFVIIGGIYLNEVEEQYVEESELFDQILSTFKFIE